VDFVPKLAVLKDCAILKGLFYGSIDIITKMQSSQVDSLELETDGNPAAETKGLIQTLQVNFGQPHTVLSETGQTIDLHLKMSVLGRERHECILAYAGKRSKSQYFQCIDGEDYFAGALIHPISFPLEDNIYDIYLDFLELTQGWNLYRIWQYVPYINQDTDGLENYKSFCKGRSHAFQTFYGEDFEVTLPSASAVGIDDDKFVMYFIAGKQKGFYLENPEQMAAYRYPKQYGPRSPSFARGTLMMQEGKRVGYLSGTASIKGHESVTLGSITDQLYTTVDNLSLVCEQMGLGAERQSYGNLMPDPIHHDRHFKVYIKHVEDAAGIAALFPNLIGATTSDHIIYLQSDICRSELELEIEAIISEK
jgi:chorismate lyase / 3-hydroxybenzoate synthase